MLLHTWSRVREVFWPHSDAQHTTPPWHGADVAAERRSPSRTRHVFKWIIKCSSSRASCFASRLLARHRNCRAWDKMPRGARISLKLCDAAGGWCCQQTIRLEPWSDQRTPSPVHREEPVAAACHPWRSGAECVVSPFVAAAHPVRIWGMYPASSIRHVGASSKCCCVRHTLEIQPYVELLTGQLSQLARHQW